MNFRKTGHTVKLDEFLYSLPLVGEHFLDPCLTECMLRVNISDSSQGEFLGAD